MKMKQAKPKHQLLWCVIGVKADKLAAPHWQYDYSRTEFNQDI